jgi:hypothetical protein
MQKEAPATGPAGAADIDRAGLTAKAEETETGSGEVEAATGKVEAATGEVEAETGEVEAKTGEVEAATGEVETMTGEVELNAGATEADAGEIRVTFEEPDAITAEKTGEIKGEIALKVRQDSQESRLLTYEDSLVQLDDYLRYGRIDLIAMLSEMATEESFADIKMITTYTGLIFVYSDSFIPADEALAKSVIEEAKSMLASVIRSDSRDSIKLTPVGDIYAMAPDTEKTIIDVILKGMSAEARYADIVTVTDSKGALYYHSDTYLTGSYAVTLMLAMAGNHYVTIAETVRDESRIYPRTTNVAIFRDQAVYGIPPGDLETVLWNLVRRPEYSDIRRIVHPVTRAIHLYSDTYVNEASAWAMMDWEEVGRANNP